VWGRKRGKRCEEQQYEINDDEEMIFIDECEKETKKKKKVSEQKVITNKYCLL